MTKIVIDTLGADMGLEPIVTGVAKALSQGMEFFPMLVGPEDQIRRIMDGEGIDPQRYAVTDCAAFISSGENPTVIFADGSSSMAMAYQKLKTDDSYGAMLSAGNTGALLIGSICRLGLLPGLKTPALASALPCNGGELLCLVDCGANIECTPEDLVRFAKMGNAFSQRYCGIARPRVALMSVGRERQKGTALIQQTHEQLRQLDMNFVGNAEGSDLVSGYADVIVTDGFSGNLLLKCAESVGKAAIQIVRSCGGDQALADRICQALYETFDFNARGAATFLGPKKTVVKMHGAANEDTVVSSIGQILRLEAAGFSQAVAEALTK